MKSIPLEGRIWLLSLSSLPDRIQSLYVLSLRTPTLHFFSKLTCKNFLFLRFRDTALFFFPFRTEKNLRQDVPWCKASNFFLYVSVSFFDVFSGAPYGSDFLILTKGIIKKVPKRSAKKWRNKLQNNSILLFIILLFFSCAKNVQRLEYYITHSLIMSLCIRY